MSSFKYIHSADLHLDSPFRGLTQIPDHIYKSIQHSTFLAYDRIIDYCIEYSVDFLLISGDIFDIEERSIKAEIYFSKGMERLNEQGINVYIIHGNHDPLNTVKTNFKWPKNVYCFSADKVEEFSFYKENEEVARIYGRSYPSKAFLENIVQDYIVRNTEIFNIGLLHTNVDGNKEHGSYAPTTLSELKNTDIDYWALGHIHRGEILSDRLPLIVYSGTSQGRNIKETGYKGCLLVEVDNSSIKQTNWLKTSQVLWEQLTVDISEVKTYDLLINILEERIEEILARKELPSIIRVNLIGRTDIHFELQKENRIEEIQEILNKQYSNQHKWLLIESIKCKTKTPISFEKILEKDTFLTDFIKKYENFKEEDFQYSKYREIGSELFNNRSIKQYITQLTDEDLKDIYQQIKDFAFEYLLEEGDS